MNTYWLSWYHIVDGHTFECSKPYYITGRSHRIERGCYIELDCICLAVDAPSMDEAHSYVQGLYQAPVELEWRFCHVHPLGWEPSWDRFPPVAPQQP